jgi:AcrR family transcriptional regulator
MARRYTLGKRAESRDQVRERIMQATMQLHDEKGVAPTTFADIAERAGVGQATVHRHFPTVGELVRSCGVHVWQEMRPPMPDMAAAVFAGAETLRERLQRLVAEVDAFYVRGSYRLKLAARDRELVPELDQFLAAADMGLEALVRTALAQVDPSDRVVRVAMTLIGLPVWMELRRLDLPAEEAVELKVRLLECGLRTASADLSGKRDAPA